MARLLVTILREARDQLTHSQLNITSEEDVTTNDNNDNEEIPPLSVFSFVSKVNNKIKKNNDVDDDNDNTAKMFVGLSLYQSNNNSNNDNDNITNDDTITNLEEKHLTDGNNNIHTIISPFYEKEFIHPNKIKTFDDARSIFLKATVRLENAKKQFPMDGILYIIFILFIIKNINIFLLYLC
jgi:hypothetical protein